ncbi:hypothetical protein FRC03_005739 [Tulasnella sp. 419]|nr:hypothetical protein FRC02_002783 [Tulasnella sp. 418]KAG8968866.1 hypothetical protein FRC03_005739 [Tulasnella sp. 419]
MTTISIGASARFSALFTTLYIGSLYLAKSGRLAFHAPPVNVPNGQERVRLANERWRNDPEVIRARLMAVTLSTIGSCLIVDAVIANSSGRTNLKELPAVVQEATERLGLELSLPSLKSFLPHLLTPILYLGPLYVDYLGYQLPFQAKWSFSEDVISKFTSWQGLRNYIVAPITEEIVFRSCVTTMMALSGASMTKMIFLGPLWFGVGKSRFVGLVFHFV